MPRRYRPPIDEVLECRRTDYGQFDILQSDPGWQGQNAIRSTETSRIPRASRRHGSRMASRVARAAAGDAGGGVSPGLHGSGVRVPRTYLKIAACCRSDINVE